MHASRSWTQVIVGVLLASCLGLYFGVVSQRVDAGAATTAGTVGAAVFAAVAAYAAMRAADRSNATSERATQALGRAFAPIPTVVWAYPADRTMPRHPKPGDRLQVTVEFARFGARDVEVRVTLGGRGQPLIEAGDFEPGIGRTFTVEHDDRATLYDVQREYVVTYWDEYRLWRWEVRGWCRLPSDGPDDADVLSRLSSFHVFPPRVVTSPDLD